MADCVFCALANDADAEQLVHRDNETASFLDLRPVFKGHTLVVPRRHVETLDQVEAGLVGTLFEVVQRVQRAVQKAVDAPGAFVAINNVVSQSVPHLHVHVVPRRPRDGLRGFFWPRQKYANGERDHYLQRVRDAFEEQ